MHLHLYTIYPEALQDTSCYKVLSVHLWMQISEARTLAFAAGIQAERSTL